MAGRSFLLGYVSLWVFGIAFGLIEAAVVVYLREIVGPLKTELFSVFPIGTLLEHWVFSVERYREAATLALMLAPAILYSNLLFERVLAYVIVFGLWDLAYYSFLYIILGWPASLLTYDVLFLLPTLWVAPVICPLLVSLSLAVFGSTYLWLARRRRPRYPKPTQWIAMGTGGVLVVAAFMANADYYLAGGMPPRFAWMPFSIGYGLAALGAGYFLLRYARQPRTRYT